MRRREFIKFLAGAAAAYPLAARAGPQMRRVGVLMGGSETDPEMVTRVATFVQSLQHSGWIVGQNIGIEYRWAGGNSDSIRKSAEELVAPKPDVILSHTSVGLESLLRASRTIPIIFTIVADPVGAGYVDSLAHPGGNATGFTVFDYSIGGKWLELLKEIAPRVRRAAVIRDPAISAGVAAWSAIQALAPTVG